MPTEDQPGRRHLGAPWKIALAAALYLFAAGYLVGLSRHQVNPDGVAYIQIARHYANGRADLAVNSWWGPLLSWLLVPAVWLNVDPLLAVRLLGVVFGLGFAFCVALIRRHLRAGTGGLATFAAALMLALTMLPAPVTPDLLTAFLLTWYFARSLRVMLRGSASYALTTGVLGGVAYLGKPYALPFVACHLCLTALGRWRLVRGGLASGPVVRPIAAGMAGLAVVSLPWAAIISAHDGSLTFSSAGRCTRAWSAIPDDALGLLPHKLLQWPRAGRMTCWENPIEVRHPWPTWSLAERGGLQRQAKAIFLNVYDALADLKQVDAFGILLCGGALGTFLGICRLRWSLSTREGIVRLWISASIALYVAGYALILVQNRYLWPIWGLLLVLSMHVLGADLLRVRCPSGRGEPEQGERDRHRAALGGVLTVCLFASVGYTAVLTAYAWSGPGGAGTEADLLKDAVRTLRIEGVVAANRWGLGLDASYWGGATFLGRFAGTEPGAIAEELAPYGRTCVLVFSDEALGDELARSPLFTVLGHAPLDRRGRSLRAFEFRPPPAQPAGAEAARTRAGSRPAR